MPEQDKQYEVVVTVDEMKEQSEEACAFIAQGTTYRFKQNDWRKKNNWPNLAGKFKVGSHVRLTCHDFSPEDASWTQHWIDKAEKADSSVPNTKADKPSKRDNFKGGGKKSDFDPHLSARQTAAHVAGVLTTLSKPENASQADVCAIWRFYAEEVHDWLTLEEAMAAFYQGAKKTLDASVIPDDIDPAYEQAQADMDAIDETFPF